MEPTSLTDDAEFSLPLEFLTDDDFLVEKENKGDECLFPYEPIGDEEKLLTGLTKKTIQPSPEDDFSGGFAFPDTKAWDSTRCGVDSRRNLNCQTRGSSQATAEWDLYCAAAEELAMMKINGYGGYSGYNKHPLAASKTSGFYSQQSLQYQKLLAIRLKQQQLVQQSRGMIVNNNKTAGHVTSWRDGSAVRDVFLGNRTGNRGSTGTGVFLPRRVTPATLEKPTFATVLVDETVVQPSVLSSPSLYDGSWRQRSNNGGFSSQMKMEQPVKEPRLPSDWAY